MKKSISLLLTLIIMISSSLCVFSQENNKEISQERKIVEMLTYIESDDIEELTRARFCQMVCEITDSEEPVMSAIVFDDVDVNSSEAKYIQRLYEMGIISGDGNGNFYPTNKIKVIDAYSMLLKMLGYGEIIKNGYPDKIIEMMNVAGLNKNINLPPDAYMDIETSYKIIYNMLYADVMLYVHEGLYQKGNTYLESVLKIYSDYGVVESSEGYSLYDEMYNEDIVVINGERFIGNGKIMSDAIGMYGKYWYKKDEHEYNKICGFLPKNNYVLKIMAKDIESYEDNTYTYYENNKLKKAKLSPGKDIIYNNEQKNDEDKMKPTYGYCMLIDNDNDSNYDVVKIYEYKNIFSTYINTLKESISYSVLTNQGIVKKDFFIGNKDYVIYNEKGKELSLEDVIPNTVLTVMESENRIKIYQNQKTITGKISTIEEDGIMVDEEKYELTADVFMDGWHGNEFIEATFYLDMFGNIAAVKKRTETTWKFAYLIKCAYINQSLENTIKFKMLNEDGEVKIYNSVNQKLKVDNLDMAVSEETANNIKEGQVIRYRANSKGEIVAIDTAEDLSSFDFQHLDGNYNNCLLRRVDGVLLYKSANKYFKKEIQSAAMTLEGEAFIDKNTIMFNVPAIVNSETEDEDYYLIKTLTENKKERVEAYNTEPSKISSDVIVVHNSSEGKTTKESRTMLVKYISREIFNSEEFIVLNGLYNGSESSLKVDARLTSKAEKLKEGDFIRIGIHDDIVRDIELLYTSDGKGELNKNYYFGSSANYASEWRYIIGNVAVAEAEKIMVTYNNGTKDINEFIRAERFNIYVYDPNLSKNRIYIGTVDDIIDIRSGGENCDTVIIGTKTHENHDMLIIKKNNN